MNIGKVGLLSALALVALAYIGRWWWLERSRTTDTARATDASSARRPRAADAVVGFVTNFFDTLGIGSFAPTTAYFKLRARMPDDEIPGTLNTETGAAHRHAIALRNFDRPRDRIVAPCI